MCAGVTLEVMEIERTASGMNAKTVKEYITTGEQPGVDYPCSSSLLSLTRQIRFIVNVASFKAFSISQIWIWIEK